ncbi:MAG: amidohydrolase family protein, partial [Opitutaceae bacterium]|nr:amidohydrolase family protein [Verrucomicrobiales bacterium]
TILLPAGRLYGLAAQCGGNQTVVDVAHDHPGQYLFFANEITDDPGARVEIRKYLNKGAIGIGEQKFEVAADSMDINRIAELAQEFRVPMLFHFQEGTYNSGLDRFHHILDKFPRVRFVGHAQTMWANIDRNYDGKSLYPTGKVTPGGLTDRLLKDHPNFYADMSAGSGLNALLRDEEHAIGFLERHQDKILYGSDCNDVIGRGPGCQGAQTIAAIRRLASSKAIERKILYGNAKKMFRL